ncbi:MAG: S41 family peptidase, partial [Polyangiaceae bacterium]
TRDGARSPEPPLGGVGTTSPLALLDAGAIDSDDKPTTFRIPSGEPPSLSCDDAQRVIAQVRQTLAYPPGTVSASLFAAQVSDWLDPHGLWSAAPGTPVAAAIERQSRALLGEIEGKRPECTAAREVGVVLEKWIKDVSRDFQAKRAAASPLELEPALGDPILDGAATTRPAREFAMLLGERIGAFERGLGPSSLVYANAASARFFPAIDADGWSRVVLAAAVRAYVPLLDPHGAWAPIDEEASVYEVDLDSHPPLAIWEKISRTAVGVRIDAGALPPLQNGDILLSMAKVSIAGLPLEQIDQLALAVSDAHLPAEAIVLRKGERTLRTLTMNMPDLATDPAVHDDLPSERVAYGEGDVVVVSIREVKDDLGEELTRAVLREKNRGSLVGVVLDLRGNGGGSTDGAITALGIFLPGVPLFPMKRRDGSLETEHAPDPASVERWAGPVATLVDGNTASAAEMIAGALSSYKRGPVVGRLTYGKGCAQEYSDDDARAGVLRLTTLLYALPDGAAVQRVGLTPSIRFAFLPLPGEEPATEREATLPDAPPTWRGPDVRDSRVVASNEAAGLMTWPTHAGNVGVCKDPDVCRAIRVLGGTKSPRISAAKTH